MMWRDTCVTWFDTPSLAICSLVTTFCRVTRQVLTWVSRDISCCDVSCDPRYKVAELRVISDYGHDQTDHTWYLDVDKKVCDFSPQEILSRDTFLFHPDLNHNPKPKPWQLTLTQTLTLPWQNFFAHGFISMVLMIWREVKFSS